MAKGQIAKEEITKRILENFSGSFKYDKEIRIPFTENGEEIQIKCVLTCAKANVEPGAENAIPGEINFGATSEGTPQPEVQKVVEVSQEEKDNIARLAATLGF